MIRVCGGAILFGHVIPAASVSFTAPVAVHPITYPPSHPTWGACTTEIPVIDALDSHHRTTTTLVIGQHSHSVIFRHVHGAKRLQAIAQLKNSNRMGGRFFASANAVDHMINERSTRSPSCPSLLVCDGCRHKTVKALNAPDPNSILSSSIVRLTFDRGASTLLVAVSCVG